MLTDGFAGTRTQKLHPSALDDFEVLAAASKGKQIVMFLDYDGTLSPIVDDPDRAFMSDEVSYSDPPALLPLLSVLSLAPLFLLWNGDTKELLHLKQMREALGSAVDSCKKVGSRRDPFDGQVSFVVDFAISRHRRDAGAFIAIVTGYPYLKSLYSLLLTIPLHLTTPSVVLAARRAPAAGGCRPCPPYLC
ncbi:hypothetical protein GW17_00038644 [Ensete ventricosum]|nr:hypothetical protein GW17_00038644 [Ensete ventricosum]